MAALRLNGTFLAGTDYCVCGRIAQERQWAWTFQYTFHKSFTSVLHSTLKKEHWDLTVPIEEQGTLHRQAALQGCWEVCQQRSSHARESVKDTSMPGLILDPC